MMDSLSETFRDEIAVTRMTRDLREAAETIGVDEARFMVDAYYSIQKMRIVANNQITALGKSEEPVAVLAYVYTQYSTLEKQIKAALDRYSGSHPAGVWARDVKGIGPVLAAGLISHIDIHKAPTVGHIYSFAGLDPTRKWEKKTKRPWNADLKVICWKIGESFVKAGGKYGDLYRQRKAFEIGKNADGEYSDQATRILEEKKIGKTTDAYKYYSGQYGAVKLTETTFAGVVVEGKSVPMLPPAHIHMRSQRYAVKRFLSHFHEAWYRIEFGKEPPLPYSVAILGHAHIE